MTNGRILDPICDMIVDLAEARTDGLTLEHAGTEYAFCSSGCRQKFSENPAMYVPKVQAWLGQIGARAEHANGSVGPSPAIDAGIRAWYESCRCCLSEAHPQIVEVLDRERAESHGA